ncbi:hypothetical protein SynMVIR181_02626 [Synechococcus sp. MVIR-18-1]|nr:hypothetical protein SynMVIR181_02626 [Synechococcus sp. MVIR-18-1]
MISPERILHSKLEESFATIFLKGAFSSNRILENNFFIAKKVSFCIFLGQTVNPLLQSFNSLTRVSRDTLMGMRRYLIY